MIPPLLAALLMSSHTAGNPPSGDHNNVNLYDDGDPVTITLEWVNGDNSAVTEIGITDCNAGNKRPETVADEVSAGTTLYDTGESGYSLGHWTQGRYYWVRHRKNAQYSNWVRADLGMFVPGAC